MIPLQGKPAVCLRVTSSFKCPRNSSVSAHSDFPSGTTAVSLPGTALGLQDALQALNSPLPVTMTTRDTSTHFQMSFSRPSTSPF